MLSLPRVAATLLTAAALAACSTTHAVPTAQTAAATSAPPTSAASSTRTPPAFPPNVTIMEMRHGGTLWFVVAAVARTPTDPKLDAAELSLKAIGYGEVIREALSECIAGLREGLKLEPTREYEHVSLAFRDAAAAQRFVDAYQPGVVGTVQVSTGCMD